MANYYNADGGCFTGNSVTFIVEEEKEGKATKMSTCNIMNLKKGMKVFTNQGISKIEAVIKIKYNGSLYKVGEMLLTAFHPIRFMTKKGKKEEDEEESKDYFPCQYPKVEKINAFNGYVYDLILENRGILSCPLSSSSVSSMDDVSSVFYVATFGHNVKSEIFSHPYFGNEKIVNDLKGFTTGKNHEMWKNGLIVSEKPQYIRENSDDNNDQRITKIVW
jgi:hypothetical protein